MAPEGETIEESHNNLDVITDYLLEKQKETNINLLWATQNLFSNPRYMNGGMTNPDVQVSIYLIIFKIESEIEGFFYFKPWQFSVRIDASPKILFSFLH